MVLLSIVRVVHPLQELCILFVSTLYFPCSCLDVTLFFSLSFIAAKVRYFECLHLHYIDTICVFFWLCALAAHPIYSSNGSLPL